MEQNKNQNKRVRQKEGRQDAVIQLMREKKFFSLDLGQCPTLIVSICVSVSSGSLSLTQLNFNSRSYKFKTL